MFWKDTLNINTTMFTAKSPQGTDFAKCFNYRVQVCISPMMSVLDKQSTESEMGRYISISLLVREQMQI